VNGFKVALAAAALFVLPASAQAQSLRGTVVDDATEEPVAGAMVTVFVRDVPLVHSRTDSAGAFLAIPGRAGPFIIRVTHPHFTPIDSLELSAHSGELVTVAVRLGRTVVPLEPLVVTGRSESRLSGFEERRRNARFGTFIERSQIRLRPGARTTDLFRAVPSVYVDAPGRGVENARATVSEFSPRAARLSMRGTIGTCEPSIYVDGVRVQQFEDSSVDDFLRPDMIEGIEIYPAAAGAPPEFSDPAGCGSIVFWSRGSLQGLQKPLLRAAAGLVSFLLLVTLAGGR
jgi:hypothetical protein